MKKILFVDLDNTLFQTRRKCPEGADLAPAAYDESGRPRSFTTAEQRELIAFFQREMIVIPVTARGLSSFRRVGLEFTSHAALDFGGLILLPDGSVDQEWSARMSQALAPAIPGLSALCLEINALALRRGLASRAALARGSEGPLFVAVKASDQAPEDIAII